MKKFLLTLLTVALAVSSIVFVGAACSDNAETGNDKIYTVTFDSDGGTPVENQQVAEGKKANEPDIPVKTGYTFAGWFVKSTEWNFLAYTVTENVDLKAKWIANTYKITFDTAGGKPLSDMEVTYNEAYTLPTPEKEDYVFLGWQENETDFSQSEIWDRTGGAKLTAKWVIAKSTITFDSDGAGEVSPMTINYKEDYSLPVITKEDYKFICWTLNGVKFENGTVLTADITLVAKWEKEKFKYVENDGKITITAYIDSATDVIIPAKINGKQVTAFTSGTFNHNTWITSVTIPDGVIGIDYSAFSGCTGLTNVTIPDSVTSIGSYAFSYCSSLTNVTIGKGVKRIEGGAFWNCNRLTSVYYLGTIDQWAEISFNSLSANPLHIAHNLYINNALVTEIVLTTATKISTCAFSGCSGLTNVTIPDSVTSIGNSAFSGCTGLSNVTIPDSVTSIGDSAFYYCSSLTNINIGNNVTSIGNSIFENCSSLTTVTIGNSVTSISYHAFYGCSNLTSITIPSGVTSIGGSSFWGCGNLTNITISNSVTSIGEWAFRDCISLTNINLPDSVTDIGKSAFYGCDNLTSVALGKGVTIIRDGAFAGCDKLVEVINNSSLNITKGSKENGYIAYYALTVKQGGTSEIVNKNDYLFYTADNVNYLLGYIGKNKELTLPLNYNGENYVIHNYAFYGCTGLTSITIPDSVTSIGDYAFRDCISLTNVTIPASVTSIGDSAFYGCGGLIKEYDGIQYVDNWVVGVVNNFLLTANIKDGTRGIADSAFYNCDRLTKLTIPDSVTSIGSSAFLCCSSLTNITIPDSVTSIGNYAFLCCTGLTSITIPDSVTSIGNSAFSGCSSLTNVTIGKGVTIIGNGAFRDCPIISATIPTTAIHSIPKGYLKTVIIICGDIIDNYAFSGCTGLTSITIGNNVTSIGNYAFSGCTNLTNITIPDSVTSIGDSAFYGCSSLTSITIPDSVASIGWGLFRNCSNLKTINYTGTKEQWDAIDKGYTWDSGVDGYTLNYNYKKEN